MTEIHFGYNYAESLSARKIACDFKAEIPQADYEAMQLCGITAPDLGLYLIGYINPVRARCRILIQLISMCI